MNAITASNKAYGSQTKYVFTIRSEIKEILFTHMPKMSFIDYLYLFGGLISMWFGISLFNLTLIIVKNLKIIVMTAFGSVNLKVKYHISFSFYPIRFPETKNKFPKLTLVVFLLILNQIIKIITTHAKYGSITRLDISKTKFSPNIRISYLIKSKNIQSINNFCIPLLLIIQIDVQLIHFFHKQFIIFLQLFIYFL